MNQHRQIVLGTVLMLASLPSSADVRDTPSERALSLPSGAPALVMKRSDWVIAREQRRPGDTAVYYMLTSDAAKLILSTYIDKSTACQSSESCLREALKNQSYQEAKEQRLFETGPFRAAQFYLDRPRGTPIMQAHVLAAAYIDGHWFDIHISKSGSERPDLAPLVELLNGLTIR